MKVEYVRHASGRLFENDLLEACSKVHPITPLVFYGPIVIGLLAWGLRRELTTFMHIVAWAPIGVLLWIALEYALHRFVFHWEGRGRISRKFHAIIHGYHHKYPDDADRLVMPLGASIPLGVVVAALLWTLDRPAATLPVFCGIVSAYLFYDYTHFAVHFFNPRTRWMKALRAHHMAHHFATPDKNYGITNRWLDRLVGTLRRRATAEKVRRAG